MPNLSFNLKNFTIENLLNDIEMGNIALPEIQRPYVWDTTKARDLIDSLYKGLPVGSIILWDIYEVNGVKEINPEIKSNPKYLVIDGQQRLTSLFSIIKNKNIISKSGHKFKLKIAFNPIEERFEVSNPAIEKDVRWIADISEIFEKPAIYSFINNYVSKLKERGITFDESQVASRIERLKGIIQYPFSIIELSSDLNPEQVSEIFVRINSTGKTLNQSDFIMTLMSVYWSEGREEIENFYKESFKEADKKSSSHNLIRINPTPENLIRSIVGLAFRRGRLGYAYLILKGRDLENKIINEELRKENFEKFKEAQRKVLDLTNWHDFVKIIHSAGFISEELISSKVTFFITYSFYLIGKEYKIEYKYLESLIRRWFVASILTQKYTGSSESIFEEDLKNLSPSDYVAYIEDEIKVNLTDDFWNIQLPERLKSSYLRNYAFSTYISSLIRDNVKVLFSDTYIKDYLNPFIKEKKKTIDVHHIFPRAVLRGRGLNTKEINQVANYLYLEYKDNIRINDKHPGEYFPELVNKYENGDFEMVYATYDLPEEFWNMEYEEFLEERRKLMANRIRRYFSTL